MLQNTTQRKNKAVGQDLTYLNFTAYKTLNT